MEDDMPTTEQAARCFAIEGWPSNPAWADIWDKLCDERVVLRFCGTAEAVVGLEANKEHSRELHAGFPGLRQDMLGLVADKDNAAYRHRLTGIHAGVFLGIPPTGKEVAISGLTWLSFKSGKITEIVYELNHAELARQLGLADI
jgi:predicted ester cyclase